MSAPALKKQERKTYDGRLRAFLDNLRLDEPLTATDPILIAAEAAVYAVHVNPGVDDMHTAQRALKTMPANSTKFERGLAMGMAFAMSALQK